MMQKADKLLWLMKQKIDGLLAKDEKLQEFLIWVYEKSFSMNTPYKPAAVRAFYSRAVFDNGALVHGGLTAAIDPIYRKIVFDFNNHKRIKYDVTFDFVLDSYLSQALANNFDFTLFARSFDHVLTLNLNHEFRESMKPIVKGLKEQLPDPDIVMHDGQIFMDFTNVQKWWKANHKIWIAQLRKVIIKYRKIGDNWQFSESQKLLLQQYYDANKLLINCLNSNCDISPKVRQEIEETLLLPIAEIEKRQR
jgi:hypothetical protein